MKKATCFIVGAGSYSGMPVRPCEGDLVIAADGGYKYLQQEGIMPDVLLGDFDSLDIVPEHRNLIRHSPIKDDTDMALAAAYGQAQGLHRFLLYGGLGGRLDHTIANLQLLTGMARAGEEIYLIGEGIILTVIHNREICFPAEAEGIISVFCMGDQAEGVYESGLKYTLDDFTMTCEVTRGVSNEFTGEESRVSVRNGSLLIIWEEKNGLPRLG